MDYGPLIVMCMTKKLYISEQLRTRVCHIQDFESYKRIVQSLKGMLQIGRRILQGVEVCNRTGEYCNRLGEFCKHTVELSWT